MPDTTYPYGTNNIVYKADAFALGVAVTVRVWDQEMSELDGSPFTLTELGHGLYYFENIFDMYGIYHAVFFEGGVAELYHSFRILDRVHLQEESRQDRMNII